MGDIDITKLYPASYSSAAKNKYFAKSNGTVEGDGYWKGERGKGGGFIVEAEACVMKWVCVWDQS